MANAKALAETLTGEGWRLVSGGTDNHLMLIDVFAKGITGKVAEKALEHAGITVNKNTIPFDTNSPMVASGIRIGTPALTTRGMKEAEMEQVGRLIARALSAVDNESALGDVRRDVQKMCDRFPLYAVAARGLRPRARPRLTRGKRQGRGDAAASQNSSSAFHST